MFCRLHLVSVLFAGFVLLSGANCFSADLENETLRNQGPKLVVNKFVICDDDFEVSLASFQSSYNPHGDPKDKYLVVLLYNSHEGTYTAFPFEKLNSSQFDLDTLIANFPFNHTDDPFELDGSILAFGGGELLSESTSTLYKIEDDDEKVITDNIHRTLKMYGITREFANRKGVSFEAVKTLLREQSASQKLCLH